MYGINTVSIRLQYYSSRFHGLRVAVFTCRIAVQLLLLYSSMFLSC